MTIKQLYLRNFRGYSEIRIPFDDSFNVIIGRNDIGKSTILEDQAIDRESLYKRKFGTREFGY